MYKEENRTWKKFKWSVENCFEMLPYIFIAIMLIPIIIITFVLSIEFAKFLVGGTI